MVFFPVFFFLRLTPVLEKNSQYIESKTKTGISDFEFITQAPTGGMINIGADVSSTKSETCFKAELRNSRMGDLEPIH